MKLSKTQTAFLAATTAAGDAGLLSPHSPGNRSAATLLSAWHRTARSLVARGLVTVSSNGSMYRAKATK